MKTEEVFRYFLIFFFAILLASLLSALLGGFFAMLVAFISPEFVADFFNPLCKDANIIRYSFAVGMIFGLFIGAAVSSLASFLAVVIRIAKAFIDTRKSHG
jgi:ABC-type multidrug transport system fused ATPase/permease subunit